MAVFFLVVGLEIKREFVVGELNEPRRAALPIAGALGGMIVPALIYAALNHGGAGAHGWGIPMATDIAFSLGVLSLLGDRVPRGITVFLAALAIADDLGAVFVIAIFYTAQLDVGALAIAAGIVTLLAVLARRKVMRLSVYLAAAPFLWFFMHASGVHATIAGVLCGPGRFPLGTRRSPLAAEAAGAQSIPPLGDVRGHAFVRPGQRRGSHRRSERTAPAPAAPHILAGLFVGKQLGVFGSIWLTVHARHCAEAADHTRWIELYGASVLCGIGFTMSLFIGALAFENAAIGEVAQCRTTGWASWPATLVSAVLGYLVLNFVLPKTRSSDP